MFASGQDATPWRVGDDVTHRDFGHGWVQGAGHGVVTVRFETRASGPGQARTFAAAGGDRGELTNANPIDSLDWPRLRRCDAIRGISPSGDSIGNVGQG